MAKEGFTFQVRFDNKPHGRVDDFGNVTFQVCPRVGECIADIDPDEVYFLVRVKEITHHPKKKKVVGVMLVERADNDIE